MSSLGVSIGLGAGYSVVNFLIVHFGWRDSFWALAVLNLAIGLPLIALFIRSLPTPARAVTRDLARGFWLLVGTQLLTAASGLVLMARLDKAAGETTQAAPLVERI